MSERFAKIAVKILRSSVNDLPCPTRWTWLALLVLAYEADNGGMVEGVASGLARAANLPLEDVERALVELEAPDAASQTPDDGGRRIRTVPGGWQVLNYEQYRAGDRATERREQVRAAQQRRREKARGGDADGAGDVLPRRALAEGAVSEVAPPPVAVGGGRPFVEGYQPTKEYPTAEARATANRRAAEIAVRLESITGQSSMRVMAHAADYNGAQRMQTRPDTMTAPRLERTLVTLEAWLQEAHARKLAGDDAWRACPRPGTVARPRAVSPSEQAAAAGFARLAAEIGAGDDGEA